jgi:hypothetical protein
MSQHTVSPRPNNAPVCLGPDGIRRETAPATGNREPETRIPEPGAWNPKPESRSPAPGTRNPNPGARRLEPETRIPEPGAWNPAPSSRCSMLDANPVGLERQSTESQVVTGSSTKLPIQSKVPATLSALTSVMSLEIVDLTHAISTGRSDGIPSDYAAPHYAVTHSPRCCSRKTPASGGRVMQRWPNVRVLMPWST